MENSFSKNQNQKSKNGIFAAFGAYGVWGVFPLFFRLLDGVGSPTIVAHRVIWSMVFVGIILKAQGRMGEVAQALKDKRALFVIFLSAILLAINWLVFIWAVENDKVLDVSLAYFINPLVSVALGMIFLGEKQNRWQWLAISIAIIAIIIQTVGLSAFPITAMTMAITFGIYGYLRKTVSVGSAPGLFIETLLMLPFALVYLAYITYSFGIGVHADPLKLAYLILTGPITAIALLMFAFAARRLRLTTIGMIQYLAPSMHFLTAVFIFDEDLNSLRLISFMLVWLSLLVFSANSFYVSKQKEN